MLRRKKSMKELSRRDFLKGAAVTTIGVSGAAGVASLAGCTDQKGGSQADWLPKSWDYETDVLVIGYGGAGLWSALTAKDEGASDVLVLEKAPVRGGGNSSINMGEFTWIDDPDEGEKYIRNFSHGLTNDKIARAFAEECEKNIDYAEKWGLEPTIQPGSAASDFTAGCEYPFLEGAKAMHVCAISQTNGVGGWKVLDAARADLGIEIVFSCHDEELIQDPETNEIVGVYTLIGDDTKKKAVKARKGVILTLGGFEFNEDLQAQYLKCYPMRGMAGWPFNTGDGISMVQKVGAQLWNMGGIISTCTAWYPENEQPYGLDSSCKADNYLWVDRLGHRWIDETVWLNPHNGWHAFMQFNDSTLADFERIPTWCIMDQNVIDAGPIGPTKGELAYGFFNMAMYMTDLPDEVGAYRGWSPDNSYEIEHGWLKKGDTIEALVDEMNKAMQELNGFQWIGLDPAEVKKSIEQYNAQCAAGKGDEFGRLPETMRPVERGPFYAYQIYPGSCSTLGGAKKNENAQVLDLDDQVIPRLYAAGCFGNMARHTYGVSGGNNAENMVWGRIAARHCCGLDPWDTK
jgi:succinate dehydrogenase/fumarate reductase flavoprotein subunit